MCTHHYYDAPCATCSIGTVRRLAYIEYCAAGQTAPGRTCPAARMPVSDVVHCVHCRSFAAGPTSSPNTFVGNMEAHLRDWNRRKDAFGPAMDAQADATIRQARAHNEWVLQQSYDPPPNIEPPLYYAGYLRFKREERRASRAQAGEPSRPSRRRRKDKEGQGQGKNK